MATNLSSAGHVKDLALADKGKVRIEWADVSMPVLRIIRERFQDVQPPSELPAPRGGASIVADVVISDVGAQHGIPVIPGADRVDSSSSNTLQYDPRTGQLQLRDRPAYDGYGYALTAGASPTSQQLRAAPLAPQSMAEFLQVPKAPPAVQALLAQVAKADPFDRMQFLRQQLYGLVIAAGNGTPAPVPVQVPWTPGPLASLAPCTPALLALFVTPTTPGPPHAGRRT